MKPARLAATALACLATNVAAQTGDSLFSVSGFGTLGAVYHDRESVAFRRDISKPDGAKARQASLAQDSMLGVQLTARPSNRLEASLQLVSRHNIDVGYTPQVTWAYAKFKPTEEISLRAGRLGIEAYMAGDSAEIGYANLMLRQLVVFYPQTHDGLDAELLLPAGNGSLRLKGMLGAPIGKQLVGDTPYKYAGSIWGALAEYNLHHWTGRLSAGQLKLKNENDNPDIVAVRNALTMAPNGARIVDALSLKNRTLSYASLALAYDNGPLRGQFDISRTSSSGWSDLATFAGFIGYRLGQFTPYLGYSREHNDRGILSTGFAPGLSAETDTLNLISGLAQGGLKTDQSDIAIGVRYDFARNAALKVQADRIRYRAPLSIIDSSLYATPYENWQQKKLHLFSMALEFVF